MCIPRRNDKEEFSRRPVLEPEFRSRDIVDHPGRCANLISLTRSSKLKLCPHIQILRTHTPLSHHRVDFFALAKFCIRDQGQGQGQDQGELTEAFRRLLRRTPLTWEQTLDGVGMAETDSQ